MESEANTMVPQDRPQPTEDLRRIAVPPDICFDIDLPPPEHAPAAAAEAAGEPKSGPERQSGAAPRTVNILFVLPMGEILDARFVRHWYADQPAKDVAAAYNAGDLFVTEAALRLTAAGQVKTTMLDHDISDRLVAEVDRDMDFIFIRGSNLIHNNSESWIERAITLLERTTVPVVVFGFGAQAAKPGHVETSPPLRRFLELVAERSVSIGVRGPFTAEVLADLGIRNVEVIGCPTFFRRNDRNLQVRVPPLEAIRRIGFTLTRRLGGNYCADPRQGMLTQRTLVKGLATRFDLSVLSQGELAEKAFYYGDADRLAAAEDELLASGWFETPDDPMVDLYRRNMFFGPRPVDYELHLASLDAVIGTRLHGNAMALCQGKPAVFINIDTRLGEFTDLFGMPSIDITEATPDAAVELLSTDAFAEFNRRFAGRYDIFRDYLETNAVPHRMARTD